MGMGYGANYADVITEENLKEIVGHELLARLAFALEADDTDYTELANDYTTDQDVLEAYSAIREKFKEETGLRLFLEEHDTEECGSRYDEVDGHYWAVEGMYQLSPEGEKIQNVVERKFFVTFG